MNEPTTIEELTTEWVNANAEKICFAAWIKNLSEQDVENFKKKFFRCEDAPCCGCCD